MYSLAAFLGVILQTLTVHTSYIAIKRYSFGLHALNSMVCTMVSCILFVVLPWLLQGFFINNIIVVIVFTPVVVCLRLYALADTKARPLIGQKLRERMEV